MKLIPVSQVWPELTQGSESSGGVGLPLPLRSYEAGPRNATLADDLTMPKLARRSRLKTSYTTLNVEFVFSLSQYDLFQSFWFNTLFNGTAVFRIPLRYPENSVLTYWNVRWIGNFMAKYLDGNWSVKGQFDLIQKSYVPEPSGLYGYAHYAVLTGDSSAATNDQLYRTADGRHYDVKV